MKKYLKSFIHRGLIFGSFGPIITGIVYYIISLSVEDFALSGAETFLAIISTYLLAFIQAGASIFNQIESWSTSKSLLCHLSTIYVAYILCYLVNSWIPFDWTFVLIFTAIFVLTYFVICIIVYLCTKNITSKFNESLK